MLTKGHFALYWASKHGYNRGVFDKNVPKTKSKATIVARNHGWSDGYHWKG